MCLYFVILAKLTNKSFELTIPFRTTVRRFEIKLVCNFFWLQWLCKEKRLTTGARGTEHTALVIVGAYSLAPRSLLLKPLRCSLQFRRRESCLIAMIILISKNQFLRLRTFISSIKKLLKVYMFDRDIPWVSTPWFFFWILRRTVRVLHRWRCKKDRYTLIRNRVYG